MHIYLICTAVHFFQASLWGQGGWGGRRGRGVYYVEVGTDSVRPEWTPFFRLGNISMGVRFHLQIYESPKCSDRGVWMTNFLLHELAKPSKLYTVWKLVHTCSVQFLLIMLHVAVLLKKGCIMRINQFIPRATIYKVPFSRCPYQWMGCVFGLLDAMSVPKSMPTYPPAMWLPSCLSFLSFLLPLCLKIRGGISPSELYHSFYDHRCSSHTLDFTNHFFLQTMHK